MASLDERPWDLLQQQKQQQQQSSGPCSTGDK